MRKLTKTISPYRASFLSAGLTVLVSSVVFLCVPACRQDGQAHSQSAQAAQKAADEVGREASSQAEPADRAADDASPETASAPPPEGSAADARVSVVKAPKANPADAEDGSADTVTDASGGDPGQSPNMRAFKLHPVDVAAMAFGPHWKKITSLSAKVHATFDRLNEKEKHYSTEGTRDLLKKDGRLLGRADLLGRVTFQTDDEEMPWAMAGQKLTKFLDGRYLYIIDKRPGKTIVTKNLPEHLKMPHLGGPPLFRVIRRLNDVERLPEEEIDGKRTVGFVGTFGNGQGKAWHWLDYDTGILLKMRVEYPEMKTTFTYQVSDVQYNVDFSEGHFTFVPPPGVDIQDRTMGGPDTSDAEASP